jgi:hypothetical protein
LAVIYRDAHGFLKGAGELHQALIDGAENDDLTGLIRAQQQRAIELLE